MADEITVIAGLRCSKSNLLVSHNTLQSVFTMSGDATSRNVQSIPTTAAGTALSIAAAVGTAGFAFFRNLDATNFVEIGVQVGGTFYPVIKLKAGEYGVCRFSVLTLYARSDTAATLLDMSMIED